MQEGYYRLAAVLLHLQILQMERYLDATFQDAYRDYKKKAFRYFGRARKE